MIELRQSERAWVTNLTVIVVKVGRCFNNRYSFVFSNFYLKAIINRRVGVDDLTRQLLYFIKYNNEP